MLFGNKKKLLIHAITEITQNNYTGKRSQTKQTNKQNTYFIFPVI